MEVFKYQKSINFMSNAKKFGIFSIILVLTSLTLLFTKGLNYGIDFAGGTIIQLQYEGVAPIDKVRNIVSKHEKYAGATVTKFGSDSEIVIRTKQASKSVKGGAKVEVQEMLASTGTFEVRRVDLVGPSVGEELKTKGLMAMLLSIIGILIYLSFRFEWRFAMASVAALVHDVTIALGMLALFQVDINLPILAAILTILGYSLNDTVIVFDRIREGIRTIKSPNMAEVIDESVTRTLSRTTLTSLTTFFVVLTLFVFGGEIIHGFSFTLLVGVVVGTYSSIFVASPILMWLNFSVVEFREKEAIATKRQKERDKQRAQFEQGTI
ncbi:MAG: Protein-export membrane protein SecF (TC 3.A.5.1.1) [uncultured Sulfurovum sp.]|uniref:Protein-export membrane protein SecF n=1 Tax=uncultured Sulfurovum sp. TaxID=269237 RepID=A0A6S6T2A6_9BACT|nr:MAG: Protein-export membrane protein SecF (TC 3.A.5.1.1) [uncultured Sulfurovum sp.]